VVVGDDIDLAEARAVTPFDDGVSEPFKLLARRHFALLTKPLPRISHAAAAASRVPKPKHRVIDRPNAAHVCGRAVRMRKSLQELHVIRKHRA
jgi:hypothetical protein